MKDFGAAAGAKRTGGGLWAPLLMAPRPEKLGLILGLALLSFGASCPPSPPTPTPTPTPVPTPTPGAPLLLRQEVPPRLTRDGKPFEPFGAIQCCMQFSTAQDTPAGRMLRRPRSFSVEGIPQNSRWPLASESWMDYTHAKGANFFHFRMGPFYGDADHESEWADIGGPYLGGAGSSWNPAFWEKYRALLAHAKGIGANVEVNVIDTWYCKHAQWGDQPMPWPKADIEACGRQSSSEQERYIRKVVSEAKEFTNVVWLTDNEGDQIQGNDCRWFEWVRTIIREEEFRSGGTVRLVGTNNTRCGGGSFDYVATHSKTALLEPLYGKHTENNERNPSGSPEQEYANFCNARAVGLHWWYWRAEQTDEEFERTLGYFSQGCSGTVGCFAPDADDPLWGENLTGAGQMRAAVEAAKAAVGEKCGSIPPHEGAFPTLAAVAAELRKAGYCASGPWGDAVAIQAPDGWWEEYHAVRFTDGCWADNSAVMPKFRWKYNGAPPPSSCPREVPTVDEILCKILQPGQGLWDCTPKYRGQPIAPEGDPSRWACEMKAMGGTPVYSLEQATGISLSTQPNPMQFKIIGSGNGMVTCTVPAFQGKLCNTQVSR